MSAEVIACSIYRDERPLAGLAGLLGGVHETAQLVLPRLVRRSRLYEVTAKNMLRIGIDLIGGVDGRVGRIPVIAGRDHDHRPRRGRAQIGVGKRVWGLALSRDGKRLYSTDGADNQVSVIDTEKRSVTAKVATGEAPWGVVIDD